MDPYAQTNIQLYEQLRRQGYSPDEIGRVAEAYGICPGLFACLYRPSGKTFIAHLVGTASILASLGVSVDIVIAGLLHAAYAHGDFGTGVYNVSAAKQSRLRRIVGAEAEEYIARYTALLWWTESNIRAVYRRVNDLDSVDRDVLLIRLANELEELLDFGWLYWSSLEGRRWYRDGIGRMVVEMAETIGFPVLAKELEEHLNRSAAADIPIEMRDETTAVMATASSMIPSRVIGLKPAPYVRRHVSPLLRQLRNSRVAHPKILYWEVCSFMRRSLRSG
jgi:(p)ppGpp synthase/HD superfamily hydrolase